MSGLDQILTLITKYTTSGAQVILKADVQNLLYSLLESYDLRRSPVLSWIDATCVRVQANADSPAHVMMCGFPNILHPGHYIDGGLSDGGIRKNTSNQDFDQDTSSTRWGTEKASQWHVVYAIAGNADTTFTLKAMPLMRFSSQATQVITLRNNLNAADIGYGFTTDELANYKLYVLNGASQGYIRTITNNNNNDATGGTITYSGDALTMSQGDWFVILPNTNFRWLGNVFNNSSSNLITFHQHNNYVMIGEAITYTGGNAVTVENISVCPLAITCQLTYESGVGGGAISHPSHTSIYNYFDNATSAGRGEIIAPSLFSKNYHVQTTNYNLSLLAYMYPNGYFG